MQWSDIPFHPPTRTLRQFAGLWLLFFGGIAVWRWYTEGTLGPSLALAALAVAVGLPGLIRPSLVRPIFVAWMILAFPIGWTVSTVLLGAVFYGLFTPLALAFRASGRDALALRRRPDRTSYWLPKATPTDVRSYFRPF